MQGNESVLAVMFYALCAGITVGGWVLGAVHSGRVRSDTVVGIAVAVLAGAMSVAMPLTVIAQTRWPITPATMPTASVLRPLDLLQFPAPPAPQVVAEVASR